MPKLTEHEKDQIKEFEEWLNNPDKVGRGVSPVLKCLLKGESHPILDAHEKEFPIDMGIGPGDDDD